MCLSVLPLGNHVGALSPTQQKRVGGFDSILCQTGWDMCVGRGCSGFHSQLDDVWVSEQFEILDFSFDLPDDIEAADLLSVQDLYSHFMAC